MTTGFLGIPAYLEIHKFHIFYCNMLLFGRRFMKTYEVIIIPLCLQDYVPKLSIGKVTYIQ